MTRHLIYQLTMNNTHTFVIQAKSLKVIQGDGASETGIARASGLPGDSANDYGKENWSPSPDTLAKDEVFLRRNRQRPALASIEEIIKEARNERMFILVDDEDRENESDRIIPGQMATPDANNFMATHGRGLDGNGLSIIGLRPNDRQFVDQKIQYRKAV